MTTVYCPFLPKAIEGTLDANVRVEPLSASACLVHIRASKSEEIDLMLS